MYTILADVGNGIKTNESNKNAMSRPTESLPKDAHIEDHGNFPKKEGSIHVSFLFSSV